MSGRQRILFRRNCEIRQVFRHLRQVRRHESSFVLEVIRNNYFISEDQIYRILSQKDAQTVSAEEFSITYREIVCNNNYYPQTA